MPTSARQIAPLFRKSPAKLRLPNGAMWASPPTSRETGDVRNRPLRKFGIFAVRTINHRAEKEPSRSWEGSSFFILPASGPAARRLRACFRDSGGGADAWARQDSRLPPAFRPAAYLSAASHPAACALDSGAGDAASGRSGAFRASARPAACRASAPASRRIHPALLLSEPLPRPLPLRRRRF